MPALADDRPSTSYVTNKKTQECSATQGRREEFRRMEDEDGQIHLSVGQHDDFECYPMRAGELIVHPEDNIILNPNSGENNWKSPPADNKNIPQTDLKELESEGKMRRFSKSLLFSKPPDR